MKIIKARPKMIAILTPKKKMPPEVEKDFNRHYNDIHLPLMIKVPGIVEIKRYKAAEGTYGGTYMEGNMYVAEYEIESEEAVEKALTSPERMEALKDKKIMDYISEYFDLVRSIYMPIHSVKKDK